MTLGIDVSSTFTAPGATPFTVEADFDVDRGETVVVLGPSGSGKTLLLEVIAGFHDHEGAVTLEGTDVAADPPERRGFGFVFQDYGLFPHMTVAENVRFGEPYREETGDADELLAELDIADLAERSPGTLSGGEAQRVALARALYVQPDVLLLDEPLSSLDVPTRASLRGDMLDILDGVSAVYVTHDRTTARTLADRILVMNDGQVVQRGPPEDIFERPASQFVARFTGSNCVPLSNGLGDAVESTDGAEWLAIRPEDLVLDEDGAAGAAGHDFSATVEHVVREDATYRVSLALDGDVVEALTTDPPDVGSTVGVTFDPEASTLI